MAALRGLPLPIHQPLTKAIMYNNVFIGSGGDPLLSQSGMTEEMAAYDRQMQDVIEKLNARRQQVMNLQQSPAQSQSQSPVWDEMDKLVDGMTDVEISALNKDSEYAEAQNRISAIISRENMRILRPMVEGAKDGKEALENLLSIAKKVKKSASEEANKNNALMNEYITGYSHLTWQEFMDAKNGKQSVKPPKK